MSDVRARISYLAVTLTLAFGGGCADDTAKISLSSSETSLDLGQGESATLNLTVGRSHFTGPVTIAITGTPDGITALATPSTLQNGTSVAQVEVHVAGTTAPGDYTFTMKATGEGVAEQSIDVDVTVTTTGTFGFSVLEPSLSVAQGGGGTATILIPRFQNNAGNVTVVASGAPAGVTATVNSTPTSASSTTVSFAAGAGATPGTYPITLVASSPGFTDQNASLSLVISSAPSTAGLSVVFCASDIPTWFAYKNEGFEWQRVSPTSNAFTFDATDHVSIAYVYSDATGNDVTVFSASRAELAASNDRDCSGPKSLSGSVANVGSTQAARIVMGTSSTVAAANGPFTLTNVNARPLDLVAMRAATAGDFVPDALIVRRSLDLTTGSTIPPIDFGSSEAVAPATNTLTITGSQSADVIDLQNTFWSATSTFAPIQQAQSLATTTPTLYSVPAGLQIAGDLHELYVDAYTQSSSAIVGHSYVEYYATPADRTIALGPLASTPTVNTVTTAPYARMRGRADVQPEYNTSVRFGYFQQPNTGPQISVTVGTSAAFLGSTPAKWDVTIPDLSTVPGFNTSWMLIPNEPTQYYVEPFSGRTDLLFGALPSLGDQVRLAYRVGLIFSAQLRAESLRATNTFVSGALPQYLRR
ncbi:MAG TPA: hypothetical protein VJ867_06155 [Gemmatimonadaceae bacterium]|nr:hypothetical protein [Gemmatimonadaceae bacterium]